MRELKIVHLEGTDRWDLAPNSEDSEWGEWGVVDAAIEKLISGNLMQRDEYDMNWVYVRSDHVESAMAVLRFDGFKVEIGR